MCSYVHGTFLTKFNLSLSVLNPVVLLCGSLLYYFLYQNPPAIPSLAAAWFVSLLCGSKFIIDWHNYGFTILALGLKSNEHSLVKIARR